MSIQLNAQKMMADKVACLIEDETDGYGRKSTKNEKSIKSLADQRDTCADIAHELRIPFDAKKQWRAEEPGLGGDLWWTGGGGSGLQGDNREQRRTRPALTGIMNRIVSGTTKCVIVYSLDRLWRSAKIAGEAMDIFVHYGCLLVDRNGLVDIFTVEGRNHVLANAVAAQAQREHATVTAPRGVFRSRDKGKLVGPANCLGLRSVGGNSGLVRHIPEEHEVIRRIFKMFLHGENGSGPMTAYRISAILMAEGYEWTYDLTQKRGIRRSHESRKIIYTDQIDKVLRDVRYIGLQKSYKETYPCPVLLYEGQPIVPHDLFQAVQDKLKERASGSKRVREQTALGGRMRCGVCGGPLARQTEHISDGRLTPARWKSVPHCNAPQGYGDAVCRHSLPNVLCDDLNAFIDETLAPLLVADLDERKSAVGDDEASIEARIKTLQRDLSVRQQWLDNTLPDLLMQAQLRAPDAWDEKTIKAMEQKMRAELSAKRSDLRAASAAKQDPLTTFADQLVSIKDVPASARRDALRAVIRWIAVLQSPSRTGKERGDKNKAKEEASNLGSLVFLTAWGTYFTARLYRDSATGSVKIRIRAATVGESLGGVADFPNPAAFFRGLQRSFEAKAYPFPAAEVTPGYTPGCEHLALDIEEIEIESDACECIQ